MRCCPSCEDQPILHLTSITEEKQEQDGYSNVFLVTYSPHEGPRWQVSSQVIDSDGEDDSLQISIQSITKSGKKSIDTTEKLRTVNPALILWFRNCNIADMADPCLAKASELSGNPNRWTISRLSRIIAHVATTFSVASKDSASLLEPTSGGGGGCRHGVVLNGRMCCTLATTARMSPTRDNESNLLVVGLYNIVDLTCDLMPTRLETVQYVPEEFFEVSASEEAMSVETFCNMTKWTTRTVCAGSNEKNAAVEEVNVERRKWGHLIFLSHVWERRGVPGSVEDLQTLQQAVQNYVEEAIRTGPTTTVKNIATADDFGVWLDYPIVPNDKDHTANCQVCLEKRRQCIAKMTALPSIATTIALHPEGTRRGWILHEMSNNTHKNVVDTDLKELHSEDRLRYGHRINLMTDGRVTFTNGSDGVELRCHEFVRLGQMPRCWPSVNLELLKKWKEAGLEDEGSVEAKDILLEYARTFHYKCQGLKRAMVVLPQLLARANVVVNSDSANEDWVSVPPVSSNPLYESDSQRSDPLHLSFPFDFDIIEREILQQESDMRELGIPESLSAATSALQRRQFVNVVMGIRAELLHGGGILHWISLSTIVQAISTTKRMVRLKHAEHVIQKVSCSIALSVPESLETEAELPDSTMDTITNGVPAVTLEVALEMLFDRLPSRPDLQEMHQYQSGRTGAWDDVIPAGEDSGLE